MWIAATCAVCGRVVSEAALRVAVTADAVISSVWPSFGPVLGGQPVVIGGIGLNVLDETRLSGGVCGTVLQRNSTQVTCLSASSNSAKRTAAVLGLVAGGTYEYVGNAGVRAGDAFRCFGLWRRFVEIVCARLKRCCAEFQ
jgi:hypothetical protein